VATIASLDITVRAETFGFEAALRCIAAIFDPDTSPLQRRIELNALAAYGEVQNFADLARRSLGISPGEIIRFAFRTGEELP
jgi:hypothetical protein